MPIWHIPILICQTHSHTRSQGHPYQTAPDRTLAKAASRPGPDFSQPFTPGFLALPHLTWTPRHPSHAASSTGDAPLNRKKENTRVQNAPNNETVFKLAEKPANPRQAETETRLRLRRHARRARNSEFKPQRLPGGQSRRRLEKPTNHSPGGGASRRGAWPRISVLSLASVP